MTVQFHATGLVVADLARSLAFYRLVGLDIPADAGKEPHVEIRTAGGLLMLDPVETIRSFDPEWTAPTGGFRMGLAFRCDSPAEVDARYAELVAAGHPGHKAPWDAFWGQRYATVLDPDGNGVDLFAAR